MRIKGISRLALAGVLVALSACGSGSSARSTTGASVSRAAAADPAHIRYISRGDEVCRAGNATIAPVNARGAEIQQGRQSPARTAALLVPVLYEGLHDYRDFYVRLKRIPPPQQDRAAAASIMDGLRRVGNDLERLTAALERGEFARVKAITAERELDHARVSAQELEFGFRVCGQPQGNSSSPGG